MIVYLAGGMHNPWRERVKAELSDVIFIDPCQHGLNEPQHYAVWDLAGVSHSDVVFAYLEIDNPSGYGMTLEIGYALGLGKVVVLVDETDNCYMTIVREASSVWFDNFDAGLAFLDNLQKVFLQ